MKSPVYRRLLPQTTVQKKCTLWMSMAFPAIFSPAIRPKFDTSHKTKTTRQLSRGEVLKYNPQLFSNPATNNLSNLKTIDSYFHSYQTLINLQIAGIR